MRTTDLAENKALLIEESVCYSDNTSPVHPTIMQALINANSGRAHAYGRDADSKAMKGLFSQVFERDVDVSIVTTGTAANALALGAVCPPFGSIYVSRHAHTLNDECGAPEMFTAGAKGPRVSNVVTSRRSLPRRSPKLDRVIHSRSPRSWPSRISPERSRLMHSKRAYVKQASVR